jgi:Cu-processing system permease protein
MAFGLQLVRLILLEALRSRLAWIVLIVAVLSFGLAQFLSSIALIESDQIRLAVVAAMLRAAAVFLVVAFVITSTVREANDKVTELLLSQPVPRWRYYISRLCGFGAVALVVAGAFAAPVLALAPSAGAAFWAASLACELLVMAAVALFCAVSTTQVLPSLAASAGLYFLARSVDTLRALAESPLNQSGSWIDAAVRSAVEAVAVAMPALDRFCQTRWLYEGAPAADELGYIALQTLVYLLVVGAASVFDLYRKSY